MTTLTALLRPTAASNPFARLAMIFRALGEGMTAYHRYEDLRARGVPHAEAAAQSFLA